MNHSKADFETCLVLLVTLILHTKYMMPTPFIYVFILAFIFLAFLGSRRVYIFWNQKQRHRPFFPLSRQEVNYMETFPNLPKKCLPVA